MPVRRPIYSEESMVLVGIGYVAAVATEVLARWGEWLDARRRMGGRATYNLPVSAATRGLRVRGARIESSSLAVRRAFYVYVVSLTVQRIRSATEVGVAPAIYEVGRGFDRVSSDY